MNATLFCLPFDDHIVPNDEVHKIPIFDLARRSYDVTLPAAKRRCVELERVYFGSSLTIEVTGFASDDHLSTCFDIRALNRFFLISYMFPTRFL